MKKKKSTNKSESPSPFKVKEENLDKTKDSIDNKEKEGDQTQPNEEQEKQELRESKVTNITTKPEKKKVTKRKSIGDDGVMLQGFVAPPKIPPSVYDDPEVKIIIRKG